MTAVTYMQAVQKMVDTLARLLDTPFKEVACSCLFRMRAVLPERLISVLFMSGLSKTQAS